MALTVKNAQTRTDPSGEVRIEEVLMRRDPAANLREMLKQLDFLTDADDYDDEFLAPSQSAMNQVRDFLTGASRHLKAAFPLGTIYADGVGGLRVEWIRPDQELRLVVSRQPDERQYIYHEQGDEYASDYLPDSIKLSEWLRWLHK